MSRNRNVSHIILVVMEAKDLYSASELDLEIVGCFLEDHEMQFTPK